MGRRGLGVARATWLLVVILLALGCGGVWAQAPGADWELTGLTEGVSRLATPASGAFFAWTRDGLMRSDDGGASWRPLVLPPGLTALAVDPTDHTILYARSGDGLHKSDDDAATWRLIHPVSERARATLAVSPADHQVLYLGLTVASPLGPIESGGTFELLRSRDGGASWEPLARGDRSQLCGWEVLILEAHPTDPNRVARASGCHAPRNAVSGTSLRISTDQGASWSDLFYERPHFPSRLVGGGGVAPERLYLLTTTRAVGSSSGSYSTALFRSDDDGASWTRLQGWCCSAEAPARLAYDPAEPDRVFVASASGDVKGSTDGGATWFEVGEAGLSEVRDLALGIDGANLYAATARGLYQLRLR